MTRRGFSLTEILVVLAILGTLAAILLPVFASARRQGYVAQSFANLRSLAQAQELYAGDWGGYAVSDWTLHGSPWPDRLEGYFPGLSEMRPPLYSAGPYSGAPPNASSGLSAVFAQGYAMNECVIPPSARPIDQGEFEDRGRSVFFAETTSFWKPFEGHMTPIELQTLVSPDGVHAENYARAGESLSHEPPFASRKYAGGGAYVFLDGHAALAPESRFSIVPLSLKTLHAQCSRGPGDPPIPSGALLYARVRSSDTVPQPLNSRL